MGDRPKWVGFLKQKDLTRVTSSNDKNRSKKLAEGFLSGLHQLRQHIAEHMNFIDANDLNISLENWNDTRSDYTVEALRVIVAQHDYVGKYLAPPMNMINNSVMGIFVQKNNQSQAQLELFDVNGFCRTVHGFKRGNEVFTVCYSLFLSKIRIRYCFRYYVMIFMFSLSIFILQQRNEDVEMKEKESHHGMNAAQFRNARSVWNEAFSSTQSVNSQQYGNPQFLYHRKDSGPSPHGVHSIENNVSIRKHRINTAQYKLPENIMPSVTNNNEYQEIRVTDNNITNPQSNGNCQSIKQETRMEMDNEEDNNGVNNKQIQDLRSQSHQSSNNGKEENDEDDEKDIDMKQNGNHNNNRDQNRNKQTAQSMEPVMLNPFNDIVDIMSELIKQQTKQEFIMSDLNGRITTLTENTRISQNIMDNVAFFRSNML